jgi:hypothetical protein
VKSQEFQLAPECYNANGPKTNSAAFSRPKQFLWFGQGVRRSGRYLVDEAKLASFVALRIGWFVRIRQKMKTIQRLGIGVRDLRRLFRRCMEPNFRGFHIVYGISAQKDAPYNLSYTRPLLSWEPVQLPGTVEYP